MRPNLMGTIAALAVASAALSACGSSSGKTHGGPSASAGPTGSPINVMTIYPDQSQASNYPGLPLVAQAYADYINAKGGIQGHPLHVSTCNDKNDGSVAATCARQAVSEKAVAVLGSFSLGSGQILPILQPESIAWLGGYALDPAEYSNPDSYPILGGPITFLATGVLAGKDPACVKTDVINYDIPAAAGLLPFIKQGLGAAKKSVNNTVKVPVTTTDFSSIVAAAKDADCVIVAIPDRSIQAYLAKAKTLGIKQKIYAPGGAIASGTMKNFASQLEGSAIASSYASPSDPAWADFKSATAGKNAVDPNEMQELNTWASYVIFNDVASTVTGDITAASFKAALDKASAVDTGGLTPTLDFTKAFPVPPLARITDTKLLTLRITGGVAKPEGDFVAYGSYFGG
jgi:ABC-type branched-subunit amino acid transport system substrate-binding protein